MRWVTTAIERSQFGRKLLVVRVCAPLLGGADSISGCYRMNAAIGPLHTWRIWIEQLVVQWLIGRDHMAAAAEPSLAQVGWQIDERACTGR